MNYLNHYNILINRAKGRKLDGYKERHHIIPKCLGGTDEITNLVDLTPEEHFVAHQLLIKIYPTNRKLIHAAVMMTVSSNAHVRNNKLFGWLRKKLAESATTRTKSNNGSFGKPWYHNPVTLEAGKYFPDLVPPGWIKGRVPLKKNLCKDCQIETKTPLQFYCVSCRSKSKKIVFKSVKVKEHFTDVDKIEALVKCDGNIRRALYYLGLNDSGTHYKKMRELNATVYPHATNVLKD